MNHNDQDQFRQVVLKHLGDHVHLLERDAIVDLVSEAEVWREFELNCSDGLAQLKREAEKMGLDYETLKTRVMGSALAWKRECEVLLEQVAIPGAELRKFKSKQWGSGLVLTVNNVPRYWLHLSGRRH